MAIALLCTHEIPTYLNHEQFSYYFHPQVSVASFLHVLILHGEEVEVEFYLSDVGPWIFKKGKRKEKKINLLNVVNSIPPEYLRNYILEIFRRDKTKITSHQRSSSKYAEKFKLTILPYHLLIIYIIPYKSPSVKRNQQKRIRFLKNIFYFI